jgi:phosphomannomutase/phosphoglucomutase
MTLPLEIFKAYDIRGIVGKTLTSPIVRSIGQALGSIARERGRNAMVVGRDGRLSGPEFAAAVSEGIRSTGTSVIDIGMVTTPMSYFAAHYTDTQSSVMITGSHNPPDYNGLKMVVDGTSLSGDDIQDLRARSKPGRLTSGAGTYRADDIAQAYYQRVVSDVRLARPLKIAVDCGNGVAGAFAPALYRRLGCEVTEMFCAVDGRFPNHHPDPSKPENLEDLKSLLAAGQHDLGMAFDGDGDRLGVVTREGHVIYPDRQLMLFASDVLAREPGATIIYDIKSTRNLKPYILKHGGVPLLWKTGHSLIKTKMKEVGAALAGEMSGHTFSRSAGTASTMDCMPERGCSRSREARQPSRAARSASRIPFTTPELNVACAKAEHHA